MEEFPFPFLGDFAQLLPVGDKPIYASPSQSSSLLTQHGHYIYGLFQTVVMLSENIRQAGNNPEAEEFRAILLRLRDGQTTQDDWMTLCQRTLEHVNMSDFTDAPRLYFDKLSVAKYNFEKLKNLRSQIAPISALHSLRNAKNAKSDASGAAVMLTNNLWQEVGLCNGATGVVEDLLFHPDRPPPCLPIATLVHFSHYKGPDFYQETLRLSPYHPIYLNGKVMVRDVPDSSCHCDCDMQWLFINQHKVKYYLKSWLT